MKRIFRTGAIILLVTGFSMMLPWLCTAGGGRSKNRSKYIGIELESKLKEYNPNAVWQKVPCERCGGTGSQTAQRFDAKKNRMVKWMEPCPSCRGRGYVGMSRM